MLVMFHVWNAVIYLSMAELKSMMCNGNRGNRGIRNQEWSGIRIIRIKIKEKCDIIAIRGEL